MIHLKTEEQLEIMAQGGAILSRILGELVAMAAPGISTVALDAYAERRMREEGGEPSFKGYRSDRRSPPFTSSVCISLNEEVVHAPATPDRTVQDGDLLKLDIGLRWGGLCTDMAVTVPIGTVDEAHLKLVRVTRESLLAGVEKVREGGWVSDVGKAVDKLVRRSGYTTVKDLVGHGVGLQVHEGPSIPNYFDPGMPAVQFVQGMAVAVEPMVNMGAEDVRMKRDGWTVVTADGSPSAHWEVTIGLTATGPRVLTPLPDVPGI